MQIDSRTVGTSDVTITNAQTSPTNYISANGEIRLRVLGTGTNKNFTCSGDYMQFTVETSGSVLSKPLANGITEEQPQLYRLHQNYPNPFNPTTKIRFELAEDARVELRVYDVLGREVAQLVDDSRPAGIHEVLFDGTYLPSGVYYCRILAVSGSNELNPFAETKKLVLAK
jgi:hypothetical protein